MIVGLLEPENATALLDYRRVVQALYARVRGAKRPREAALAWRRERDRLFRAHPQSPIPRHERASFSGLPYFDYDERFRVLAEMEPAEAIPLELPTGGDRTYRFHRVGTLHFRLAAVDGGLDAYWLDGYGGGLFVPFRDGTSSTRTYGAGRYLLDSAKGADLGEVEGKLVLDFNFAYNPSCSYDPRWVCPLAPPGNVLGLSVEAGEKCASS